MCSSTLLNTSMQMTSPQIKLQCPGHHYKSHTLNHYTVLHPFLFMPERNKERKRERGVTVVAAAKEKASCRISLTSFSRAYQYGFASSSSYGDGTAVAGLSPALRKLFCLQIATSAIQKERVFGQLQNYVGQ